ncbi:MAG: SAP domain-containing protein [Streptococcus infantarius]|nr:SAP domain-containing protein [Streptococcus infantarius]
MNFFDFLFKKKEKQLVSDYVDRESKKEIDRILLTKLECGLLPGEVVLLDWVNEKSIDKPFPSYFTFDYGINPEESFQTLINENFIYICNDLHPLKVSELKQILKDNNLSLKGKKADLISRIERKIDLSTLNLPKVSLLTERGMKTLEKNQGIILAHKDSDFNIPLFMEYQKKMSSTSSIYSDIKWFYLNESVLKNTNNFDYGFVRNNKMAQAKMLQSERRYFDSLPFWIEVLFFDLSGLHNNFNIDGNLWYFENMAVQYVINHIKQCAAELNANEIEVAFVRARDMFYNLKQDTFLSEEDFNCFRTNLLLYDAEDYNEYMKKYKE